MKAKDFKLISLALYQEDILITLNPDSNLSMRFGKEFKGNLTARVWGDGSFPYSADTINKNEAEVVALTIKVEDDEFNISCDEVESIKRVS